MPDSIDLARYSVFTPPDPFEDHVGPLYFRIDGDARTHVECVSRPVWRLLRPRTRLRRFEFGHEVSAFDCGEALDRSGGRLRLQIVGGGDCRRVSAGTGDSNQREN